jgi:hypothetical protein
VCGLQYYHHAHSSNIFLCCLTQNTSWFQYEGYGITVRHDTVRTEVYGSTVRYDISYDTVLVLRYLYLYRELVPKTVRSTVYGNSPTPNMKKPCKNCLSVIRVLRPRLRALASGCGPQARSRTPTPRSKLAKLELR